MKVPSFLLKKLYVKGSLKNTDGGFEFLLKNTLMDGTLTRFVRLAVDNREVPPETITIAAGGTSWSATDISESNPAPFKMDVEVTVSVSGNTLKPGDHEVEIAATTKEYGDIEFTVKDAL